MGSISVGLNEATRPGEKIYKVNPVMGLINTKVEDLIHYCKDDWSIKPYSPTIVKSIGYLTPKNTYMRWEIKKPRQINKEVNNLLKYITRYGIPWMEKMSDRDELLNALKAREGIPGYFIYRIPALLVIMGKKDEALFYAESFYQQLKKSNKTVFDEYKNFYAEFLKV